MEDRKVEQKRYLEIKIRQKAEARFNETKEMLFSNIRSAFEKTFGTTTPNGQTMVTISEIAKRLDEHKELYIQKFMNEEYESVQKHLDALLYLQI